MAAEPIEVATLLLVLPYYLVDGLMGYVLALELEIAGYLLWGPLIMCEQIYHLLYQFLAHGAVSRLAVLVVCGIALGALP